MSDQRTLPAGPYRYERINTLNEYFVFCGQEVLAIVFPIPSKPESAQLFAELFANSVAAFEALEASKAILTQMARAFPTESVREVLANVTAVLEGRS